MDMTQKELAKYLQVADSTLSYWEMGKYEPDNETLRKLSRFFKVPIDYILGGDFASWDIDGNTMPYTDVDMSRFADSDISVSESKPAYIINGKNENFIEPATFDRQLSIPAGTSMPDITKSATTSGAEYGLKSTQAAFNRVEFEGLTQGEIDVLAEYAEFIKSRRKKE